MIRYRLLDHTADALVEAYGKTLDEIFSNAAYAMFDQITDPTQVETTGEVKIILSAQSKEQLLVDFLQELLFLHDTENLVFKEFIVHTNGRTLEAVVRGEEFDAARHQKRSVVKGVTYHKLEIDQKSGKATVLFDV
jgi:SHS2 domain-containing protein